MVEKLKDCPHCGLGGDELEIPKADRPLPFYVYCDGCGCRTGYHVTKESAIAAWNRRSPEAREVLVGFRVHSPMISRMPVKARGIGPETTELFYPLHREHDAREAARLMRAEFQPLFAKEQPE